MLSALFQKSSAGRWWSAPQFGLTLACLACLAPFADKAFHIDDPLFIWVGQHIQRDPIDFFGFTINWYGTEMSVANVSKNPPLVSYYLALVGWLFGWSEVALHVGMLLPACGAILGTYRLAQRFCSRPALAALAALATPVFLVSSSTVMSDTSMLCFWVWSVHLWDVGLDRKNRRLLRLAGLLAAASALTKYFGLSLFLLLPAYALARRDKVLLWLPTLALPCGLLVGYQWWTDWHYGRGLLLDAGSYAAAKRWHAPQVWDKTLIALAFAGGGVASLACYWPLLWSRRTLVLSGLAPAILLVVLSFQNTIGDHLLRWNGNDPFNEERVLLRDDAARQVSAFNPGDDPRWWFIVQLACWAAAGLGVLALAASDLWTHRDARSLLLFLWVAGTSVFALFMNWTINGRSILPLAPVVGLLIMRRIDDKYGQAMESPGWRLAWPLVPAVALALMVLWADYELAGSARVAARLVHAELAGRTGACWFTGHWGFQYYMQEQGAQPFDYRRRRIQPGDAIAIPARNSNALAIQRSSVRSWKFLEIPTCRWLATQDDLVGAGFYSDRFGPLPFVFGNIPSGRLLLVEAAEGFK